MTPDQTQTKGHRARTLEADYRWTRDNLRVAEESVRDGRARLKQIMADLVDQMVADKGLSTKNSFERITVSRFQGEATPAYAGEYFLALWPDELVLMVRFHLVKANSEPRVRPEGSTDLFIAGWPEEDEAA